MFMVVVTVIEVRGDQVRIGIDAPREVQVHREEIFRQLEAEYAAAAHTADRARRVVARMPSNSSTQRSEGTDRSSPD